MKKDPEADADEKQLRDFSGIDNNLGRDVGMKFRQAFPGNKASLNELVALVRQLGITKEQLLGGKQKEATPKK